MREPNTGKDKQGADNQDNDCPYLFVHGDSVSTLLQFNHLDIQLDNPKQEPSPPHFTLDDKVILSLFGKPHALYNHLCSFTNLPFTRFPVA